MVASVVVEDTSAFSGATASYFHECRAGKPSDDASSLQSPKDRKKREISSPAGLDCSVWVSKRQRPPRQHNTSVCDVRVQNYKAKGPLDVADWSLFDPGRKQKTANALLDTIQPGQFEAGAVSCEDLPVPEEELVEAISTILENICTINNCRMLSSSSFNEGASFTSPRFPDGSSSIFFSLQKPSIEMRYYISRLVKYMQVSQSSFIVALIYLDRVHAADEALALNDLNVHRLLTTALTVACKFLEDEVHRNSTVSRIGGVPSTAEMNLLETQFLRRMNWNCFVSVSHYDLYKANIFNRNSSFTLLSDICPSSCSESLSESDITLQGDDYQFEQDTCQQCRAFYGSELDLAHYSSSLL